ETSAPIDQLIRGIIGLDAVVTMTFGTFILIEMFSPMPSAIAVFTPARSIVAEYINQILTSGGDRKLLIFFGDPQLFGLAIPDALFRIGTWIFLGAIAVGYVLIGPRHFFSKGLNNFDGVVLPGDSRRAMMFRARPLLTRRLQLAFFYENRSPFLAKHDLPFRALLRFLMMSFFLLVAIGTFLSPDAMSYFRHGLVVGGFVLTAWFHVAVIHTILTIRVRSDFRQKWKTPFGFSLGVVFFDFAIMAGLAIFSVAFVAFGIGMNHAELAALRYNDFLAGPADLLSFVIEWVLISCLYLLTVQIVSKLMGLASLSRVVVFIFVKLYMTVSLLGPLVIGAIAVAMGRSRYGVREDPGLIQTLVSSLAHFSPIARFMVTTDSGRKPFGDSFLGTHGYWFYQPGWLILLTLGLLWKLNRRPKDYAETIDGPAPLPELLAETQSASIKKQEKVRSKEAQSDTSVVSLELSPKQPVLKDKLVEDPAPEEEMMTFKEVRPDTETIGLEAADIPKVEDQANRDAGEQKGESK
ncbi:MAG: hypothetical protein P1V97_34610, partial [Planctomycetota bacterium]|nr:hypothetical protein [Planctomycetota bacterium]